MNRQAILSGILRWLRLVGWVAISLSIGVFMMSFWYPTTLAVLLTVIVRTSLSKTIKTFKLGKISLFPFYMDGFEMEVKAIGKNPDLLVSWKRFAIHIDFRWFTDMPMRRLAFLQGQNLPILPHPLVTFEFQSMHMKSETMMFKHMLEPSSKARPPKYDDNTESWIMTRIRRFKTYLVLLRFGRLLARLLDRFKYVVMNSIILLFEVRFLDISFDFHMPVHQCSMHGHADMMSLVFTHSKELQDEGFQIINVIQGGSMEVFDEGLTAVHYSGKAARISVDYHHISKMMDIYINLYGAEDDMAVHIKPFLSLYMKYQRAEDDSIETKMSLGLPTNGKMSILMEMEHMKVSVKDERCPRLLIMTMDRVKAEMANFMLTTDKKRTHKGKMCDMSPQYADRMIPPLLNFVYNIGSNVEKVMKVLCGKVVFQVKENNLETVHSRYDHSDINKRYTVLDVCMNKVLEVINSGEYIDQDHMAIHVKYANFEHCSSDLFHWLVVLQDTSDRLPSCRFNHKKNNEMKIMMDYFIISLQPYAYNHDVYTPANTELYSFNSHVHTCRMLPQIPLDDNRWVCYTLTQMIVQVERKLHVKENTGHYSMEIEKMTIHAYTPHLDLRKQYFVKTPRQYRPRTRKQGGSFRKTGSLEMSTDSDADDDEDPLDFIPTFSHVDIRSELFEEIIDSYEERRWDESMDRIDGVEDDLHSVSIWTFDSFSAAFWLGAKMEFEFVKSRVFTISMDVFSWSRDLSSLRTKYDIVSLKHSNQDSYGLEVMWLPNAMNVGMDKVHCNLSLAGGISLLTAFGMIKQSVNRINFTMSATKQRAPDLASAMMKTVVPPGSHYASHHSRSSLAAPAPEEKKPEPVQSRTRVSVREMIMVIAAECDLNQNHIDCASNGSQSVNNSHNNHVMTVLMQNMVSESRGSQMGVVISAVDCRLSKFPVKSFLVLYNFSAGKTKIGASMPKNKCKEDYDEMDCSMDRVSFHLHPLMEVGVFVDSMLLQYNAFKVALGPLSTLLDSIISPSEDSQFYNAVEEEDSFIASNVSSADLDLYSTYGSQDVVCSPPTEVKSVADPVNSRFIAKLKINKMEINFDAPWENIFKDDLMTILYDTMIMEVDNTLSFAEIEDLISLLDIGEENVNTATSDMVLRYGNMSGGDVKFACNKFEVNLLTQKEVLLSVSDLSFVGPVYNASVIDERIPVDVKLIDINDALLVSDASIEAVYRRQRTTFDKSSRKPGNPPETDRSDQMYDTPSTAEGWVVQPVQGVPLFALQSTRQGSSKVYFDMSVNCKSISLHVFPDTLKCINVINTVLEICQPPNRDPSPCMTPWDTMRFFLHGPFTLNIDKLEMCHHANDYMNQEVLLTVNIDRYRLFVDHSNLEVATKDIRVEAELNTVILTRRHRSARSNQRMKHVAKFVHIPSFVLAVQHKYHVDYVTFMKKLHSKSIYTHHDIYLLPAISADSVDDGSMFNLLYNPANSPEKEGKLQYLRKDLVRYFYKGEFSPFLMYMSHDKYYYFRSRPCSITYNIEMRLANGVNSYAIPTYGTDGIDDKLPVLMFFRVDNVIRVIDAINHSSSPEDIAAPTRGAATISLLTNGIVKPPTTLSLPQVVNSLDVTMIINRALLVAWPSRTCMLGIVLHQQLSELQIRITRKMPQGSNEDKPKPEAKTPRSSLFSFTESFYLGGQVDLSSGKIPEVDDKLYPMQIDHMVMDIYFAEIYARNLNLSQPDVQEQLVKYNVPTMLSSNMRQSGSDYARNSVGANGMPRPSTSARASIDATSGADEDGQVFEPSKLEHVYSLMNNIRKLTYASKVIISLTENGSVANKLNTFVSTGILSVIDDAENLDAFFARANKSEEGYGTPKASSKKNQKGFLIGKEWRRFTLGDNPVDSRRLTLLRRSKLGSTPKLGSFSNRKHSNSVGSAGSVVLSKRRMTMMPVISSTPSKEVSASKGYRASLISFKQNHAAFTPPQFALPGSYSRNQPSNAFVGNINATGKVGNAHPTAASQDDVSSFGNKIWGLRVIDTKFLLTIDIRDSLFIFVSRSMDFITAGSNDDHTKDPDNEKYVHQADKSDERQSDNGEDDSVKNIDMALINAAASSARRNSKSFSTIRRNSINKASLSDFLQVSDEQPDTSTSIQHHLDVNTNEDNAIAGLSDSESVAESTIAKHLLNVPEELSPNKKLGQFDFSVDPTASRRISAEALEALEGMRLASDSPGQNTTIAARNRNYNTGGRGLKRAAAVHRRGSLFNKSIDVGQSDSQRVSSHFPSLDNPATPLASSKGGSKQSQPTAKANKGNKHTSLNQFFFMVELIDPQLNFLDTDSHSSLLIVAGRSSLEGKRMNSATLPSLQNTSAVVADTEEHIDMNTPKRRQEIRLRMDNVSAYTVPTANDDDEDDEVYWKNTQSSVESYQLKPLQSTAKAALNKTFTTPVFDRRLSDQSNMTSPKNKKLTINTEPFSSFLSSPDSLNSNSSNVSMAPTPRKVYKFRPDKVDPATMQMAIKDFQIRAVYIFWTDVTVSEAKELKIIRSKEDMICTFRLELPNLAVDVNSKQFHITISVIKNVMLVPPPHLQNKRAAENAAANSNVIELQRNPEVLQKYDVKPSNAPLDINYKNARDEIKAYVDECLGSNLFDLSNQQTERYTEVFIGRLTWVLRNNTSASNNVTAAYPQPSSLYGSPPPNNSSSAPMSSKGEKEYELVESGFIGIYATLTFTKSRCINSLLEIQRFWAKNIDPTSGVSIAPRGSIGSTLPDPLSKATSTGGIDRNVVVQPVLAEEDFCARCHNVFKIEENHSAACTFHADDDGNPGVFKAILLKDELTGQDTMIEAWTCCMRHHKFAPGCSMRPHICKEVMISLRAEVYPTTKIDNVEVTIFKTLDVSIFPGANYDLKLQVTRNLSDFLHKYFSLESVDNDAVETTSLPDTASDTTMTGITRRHSKTIDSIESSGGSESSHGPKEKRKSLVSFIKKKTFVRRFTQGDISPDVQKQAASGLKPTSSWSFGSRKSTTSSTTSDNNPNVQGTSRERSSIKSGTPASAPQVAGSADAKGGKQKSSKQEGLYIKYMRVGDINVDVSTIGFAINLDKFKAVMEPFFCRGEVMTWTRLIWTFERHLVWSLTKHTATTGLNKIGEFLRINNKAQSMQLLLKDDKMDPEQMLAVKRAMLLGSPEAKNAPSRSRGATVPTPSVSVKSPAPSIVPVKSPTSSLPAVRSPSVPPKGSLSINLFQRQQRQEAVNELKEESQDKEKGVKDKSRDSNMASLLGRSV